MSFDEEHTCFYVYKNNAPIILEMTDQEIGLLFRNMLLYETNQELLPMPPQVNMAFQFIKNGLDVDYKKWSEIHDAQVAGGKTGAQKRWNSNRSPKVTQGHPRSAWDSHYNNIDNNKDIDNKGDMGNLKTPIDTQTENFQGEEEDDLYAFARSIGCKVDEHGIIYGGDEE